MRPGNTSYALVSISDCLSIRARRGLKINDRAHRARLNSNKDDNEELVDHFGGMQTTVRLCPSTLCAIFIPVVSE